MTDAENDQLRHDNAMLREAAASSASGVTEAENETTIIALTAEITRLKQFVVEVQAMPEAWLRIAGMLDIADGSNQRSEGYRDCAAELSRALTDGCWTDVGMSKNEPMDDVRVTKKDGSPKRRYVVDYGYPDAIVRTDALGADRMVVVHRDATGEPYCFHSPLESGPVHCTLCETPGVRVAMVVEDE